MKILKIRLMNLNSLYGKWEIDLSLPEYMTNGLFLITGPTGAGKTTILDAITLALFGQTPRLGRIGRKYNEIMSRGTGECFAEVVFRTGREEYRAFWAQRRARKRPEGELQPPVHELSHVSGRIIESRPSRVKTEIEEITMMDFFRFTRSILLAQGEFAAFLKARPGDRGPILEQITGTEIYSRISIGVFERMRREEDTLRSLEEGIKMLDVFSKERLDELQRKIDGTREELKNLSSKLAFLRELLSCRQAIIDLRKGLEKRKQELMAVKDEVKERREEFERLDRALRVFPLESEFQHICSLKGKIEEMEQERKNLLSHLSHLQKKVEEKRDKHRFSQERVSTLEREKRELDNIIKRVRSLDGAMEVKRAELFRVVEQKRDLVQEIQKACLRAEELNRTKERFTLEVSNIKERLESLSLYSPLVTELSGLEEKISRYREFLENRTSLSKEVSRLEKEITDLETTQKEFCLRLKSKQKFLEDVQQHIRRLEYGFSSGKGEGERAHLSKRIKEVHQRLGICISLEEFLKRKEELEDRLHKDTQKVQEIGKDIDEIVTQRQRLDKEIEKKERSLEEKIETERYIEKVLSLEEERKHLVPGKPCPLCGSLEHPYVRDLPREMSLSGQEVKALKEELHLIIRQREELFSKEVALGERIRAFHREIERCREERGAVEHRIASLLKELEIDREVISLIEVEEIKKALSLELESMEDRLKEMDNIDKKLRLLREKAAHARDEVYNIKEEIGKIENALSSRGSLKENIYQRLSSLDPKIGEFEKQIQRGLLPFGYKGEIELDRALSFVHELKLRCKEYVELEKHLRDVGDSLSRVVVEEAALSKELDEKRRELQGIERVEKELSGEIEDLQRRRKELFGSREVSEEERRLQRVLKEAQDELYNIDRELISLNTQIQEKARYLGKVERNIEEKRTLLEKTEKEFLLTLREKDIYSFEEFLGCRLSLEEIDRLKARREEIFSREKALKREIEQIEEEIEHREMELEERDAPSLEEIRKDISFCEGERDRLLKSIGEMEHTLSYQRSLAHTYKEKMREIERQRKRVEGWRSLSLLIGSSDGKKFRSFAQGITFETLLAYANIRLRSMTDRYLLVPHPSEPLEIKVMDNYYGGEIRSVKNLSGGESFLVSLSLALGLSSMAGERGSIDSMFLDEGFGTLDEDSLDVALSALSSLWEEGKLIGVISHIPALRERIFLSMEVTPMGGGRSVIKGSGVKRL